MAEKLSIQIALEGGKEIEKQLADIGEAGQKAFADIEKSASQAGGFKELKPEEVTKKLEDLGIKGTAAFDKIQAAVKSAGRWEGLVQNVAALETAFVTLAKTAAVVGAAVVAAGVALSRYTSEAAKTAEALGPLADLSGRTVQSVSALQIAFAEGGVSVQKFASEFTNLEVKVAEAARTMAADVEASSQRIASAHQAVAASALSVEEAELALRELQFKARGIDPRTNPNIQRARAALALEAAQQRVAAARLAQQKAQQEARKAEANDLQKNIKLYQQMAAGAQVAFDPLTTQATKSAALFAALAQAGKNYTFVLADILKNASALERVQIAKALGLDPKTVETLQQGSVALKAQQAAVEALGIALSDTDRNNLQAFSNTWSKLGATALAALEKLGAALAPIGTLIGQGLQVALEAVIVGFQAIGSVINKVATGGAAAIKFMVDAVVGLGTGIANLVAAVGSITWDVLQTGVAAWNALETAVTSAGTAITDFVSKIGSITWDVISGAGVAAWNAIADAIQAAIDKLLVFIGLKPSAPATGGGAPGKAAGGLLGGRGSGTSDSNLAWVSRGEHIMPARAVAQPGVLAFLEALRRSGGNLSRVLDGMGRFALGGMIRGPMPAFAAGGLAGGMSNVTIQFPGLPAIGGLRASSDVVDQLHRAAALAQVRSGGRKPSRYS